MNCSDLDDLLKPLDSIRYSNANLYRLASESPDLQGGCRERIHYVMLFLQEMITKFLHWNTKLVQQAKGGGIARVACQVNPELRGQQQEPTEIAA